MQAQGKRAKLRMEFRGSINEIFSELSMAFSKRDIAPKSAAAADIVALGDSWLSLAISKALIEPIPKIEDQEWFSGLSEKWKVMKPFRYNTKDVLCYEFCMKLLSE